MNFGLDFPKSAAQHAILNLIVFQIKGEYQFTYLELHYVLVEDLKRGKMIYNDKG